MPLTVEETRRIAAEVLAADHPALRVVGVKTEGGSSYIEVIVVVANRHAEPCRLSIGVQRDESGNRHNWDRLQSDGRLTSLIEPEWYSTD